jgi:ribosome-associated heat shock protein Hsp15
MEGQRLDKWLWCARLVRTRTLANALVTAGKIRINGERAPKPSRLVQAGDVVTGTRAGRLFVVRVVKGAPRRGSAGIAQSLFEDLTPPIAAGVTEPVLSRGPRPTKRDRRRIDAFCAEDS